LQETRKQGNEGRLTFVDEALPGFKNLVAWQRARRLAALVDEFAKGFPRLEGVLRSQMRRTAISVGANIAEGYCRGAIGDYIRYCEIARGSLGELGNHLAHAEDIGLATQCPWYPKLLDAYSETLAVLNGLVAALKRKRDTGEWDRAFAVREFAAPYIGTQIEESSS